MAFYAVITGTTHVWCNLVESTVSVVQQEINGIAHEVSDSENSRLNPFILSRRRDTTLVIFSWVCENRVTRIEAHTTIR